MGSYTELYIADYPIISSKSYAIPSVMVIFRESDKRKFHRLLSERNWITWGKTLPEDDSLEYAITYENIVENVCDRLEIMGFTLERCRNEFEQIRHENIKEYESMSDDDFSTNIIKTLKLLTFDKYLEVISEVIHNKERTYNFDYEAINKLDPIRRHIFSDTENILGFFGTDIRSLIRTICSIVPRKATVIQDLTEVVDAGYYTESTPVCELSIKSFSEDHIENTPIIILTEGSTDADILQKGLKLLYPHLVDYYKFFDFSPFHARGGAGNLVNIIKAFSSAGISNRIIVIFDNDTAAFDARRSVSKLPLPNNIAVCNYPNTEFLRNYPTLGPSGLSMLDINGLAASIELYLGADVLKNESGTLHPIQWKGFIEGMSQYQGEIMNKAKIQRAFNKKIARCSETPDEMQFADWYDFRLLFQLIFDTFK